tara:strand:+ start:1186 stop:1305 length:120 start_codon:yes stop_codon:yes gene_type:complete
VEVVAGRFLLAADIFVWELDFGYDLVVLRYFFVSEVLCL